MEQHQSVVRGPTHMLLVDSVTEDSTRTQVLHTCPARKKLLPAYDVGTPPTQFAAVTQCTTNRPPTAIKLP